MLCLSDIQLFLLLLWKMAPRWVRKGYGSVPLAAGKKVLVLDYAPMWLTMFSLASVAIVSLSDSPLFARWVSSAVACGLVFQPDQATVKFPGQLAPQLLWASQTPLRFSALSSTQTLDRSDSAPHYHRPSCRPTSLRLSCVSDMQPHSGTYGNF